MMTPRERFLRAAEQKWTDKVCNEFVGGMQTVSIVDQKPYGYTALCEYLGITDYPRPISDPIWGDVKNVDVRILDKFGCDFRYVQRGMPHLEELPNGYFRSQFGTLWRKGYGESRQGVPRLMLAPDNEQPAGKLKTTRDIEEYPFWPDTESNKARQTMEKEAAQAGGLARKLYKETDYAVAFCGSSPYSSERHRFTRGFTQSFTDMKTNPEFYHAFAGRMLQEGMDKAEIYLNAVGDYVDRVNAGPGDMGTQQGPMLSLEDFREFCLPYQVESFRLIRKYTKAKICAHMCGSFHLYVEDLARIGLDIIGQQIGFAHMNEPERLKQDFGDKITFWGGIDTQIVLPRFSADRIRKWVKRCVETLSPGYITSANHVIERDVSPDKIWIAHKAIEEVGTFS